MRRLLRWAAVIIGISLGTLFLLFLLLVWLTIMCPGGRCD